jgi:TRAP-type C4-dicarboxylate transport system permease small subunit
MQKSVLRRSLRMPAYMASVALFSLMVLTFCDVMLRSILNAPIESAADLTRLLMAITVFSVLPSVSAKGQQISVDLLDDKFIKFGSMHWREAVVSLFCGGILLLPAERVFVLAERARSYGDVMEYLGLPLHYIGWFVALMTVLTAIALIARGFVALFRPDLLEVLSDD